MGDQNIPQEIKDLDTPLQFFLYLFTPATLKNYNPKKPHKWGYKAFVLSGESGLTYDFELYAGAQSNVVLEGQTDLGVSSNVAMRLSNSIPQNMN